MKRCRFGGLLLTALLAVSLFTTRAAERRHIPAADALTQGSEAALAGDWPRASVLIGQAEQSWQEGWHLSAAISDHAPMESIDGLFAQLRVYLQLQDGPAAAAVCAELSRELEAMADAHALNWWNIL